MEKVSKKYLFFIFIFFLFFVPLLAQGVNLELKRLQDNCEVGIQAENRCLNYCEELCSKEEVYLATSSDPANPYHENYDYFQFCQQKACTPNGPCTFTECLYYTTQPPPSPSQKPPELKWCAKASGWWSIPAWIACGIEYLVSLPLRVSVAVLVFFASGLAFVSSFLCAFAHYFFSLVYPDLLSLAASRVDEILAIVNEVRSFVIPLIFLGLALVGLATILRIAEYEAKKTFFPLLIVAVLIFFSTPIVQGIVTLGNIATNAILSATFQGPHLNLLGTAEIFHSTIASEMRILWGDGDFIECFFTPCGWYNPPKGPFIVDILLLMANSLLGAFFFILLAVLVFAYLCVFVLRIAFVWILLIIAPVAFLTAAFRSSPELKAILPGPLNWEGWWKALLEWAFIGVFLGFFLFAAERITTTIMSVAGHLVKFTGTSFIQFESIKDPQNSVMGRMANFYFTPTTPSGNSLPVAPATLFLYFLSYVAAIGILWWGLRNTPGMVGEFAKRFYDFGAKIASLGALAVGAGAGALTGMVLGPVVLEPLAKVGAKATQKLEAWEGKISGWQAKPSKAGKLGLFGKKVVGDVGKGLAETGKILVKGLDLQRGLEISTEIMKERLGKRLGEIPYYKEYTEAKEKAIAKDPSLIRDERKREVYIKKLSLTDFANMSEKALANPDVLKYIRGDQLAGMIIRLTRAQMDALADGLRQLEPSVKQRLQLELSVVGTKTLTKYQKLFADQYFGGRMLP
jgi:hypothetical protein